jgi:hypothetical protein
MQHRIARLGQLYSKLTQERNIMKKTLLAVTIAMAMTCYGQTSPSGSSSSSDTQSSGSSAQSGSTSGSSTQSGSTATDHSTMHHKGGHKGAAASGDTASGSGGSKTLTGCIAEKNGQYWLKTSKGNYHLMSSQDLSAHVGHEVKATGTTSMGPAPGGSDSDKSADNASTTGKTSSAGKNVRHLEVSNLDMVSEQCTMGKSAKGGMGHKKAKSSTTSPS